MMKSQATKDDGNITPTLWVVAIVGLILTLASSLFFGARAMPSTLFGAALAVSNLWAMGRLVRGLLGGGQGRSWAPIGFVKLAVLFVVLGVVVKQGWVSVLPFVLGYAALPLGITVAQLRGSPAQE